MIQDFFIQLDVLYSLTKIVPSSSRHSVYTLVISYNIVHILNVEIYSIKEFQ